MKNHHASTLRGGNHRLNLLFWLIPLAFLFAGAAAQDIGNVLADGANTAVTIKHSLRPVRVQYDRGGAISWFYQRVKLNNANDTEITKEGGLVATTRALAVFKAQAVTINGVTLTGEEWLAFGAKFGKNNWEVDHP